MARTFGSPDSPIPERLNNRSDWPSNSVLRDSPPTTSSYPTSRATPSHRSPLGENDQKGQRPYQSAGNEELKCSGREQEPFTPRKTSYLQETATGGYYTRHDGEDLYSGKATKSMRYARTQMSHSGDWDERTGKAKGEGFEPGDCLSGPLGRSG